MAGCKLRRGISFFSFFFFTSSITLSLWARKSDVSGADKLRSDWKVSATWVESRLGKIPIRVRDEEGGRERERERRGSDGGSNEGWWLEDFFRSSYRNMGHSLFSRSSRSRVSGLLHFANTRVFLSICFSRCNLTRLRAYASASGEVYVTIKVLYLDYFDLSKDCTL